MPDPTDDAAARTAVLGWALPGAAARPVTLTSGQADPLFTWASDHRLGGLLWAALDGGAITLATADIERARDLQLGELRRSLRIEATAAQVVEALAEAGVRSRLLKGLAAAHLDYPDPAWRNSVDADVLIGRRDLTRALETLAGLGITRSRPGLAPWWERRFARTVELSSPAGVEVDLHMALAVGWFGVRLDHDHLLALPADTFALGGVPAPTLPGPARLLATCYSIVLSRGDHDRLLRDLAQQLLVSGCDWSAALAIARSGDGEAVLHEALRLAGNAIPALAAHSAVRSGALTPSRSAAEALLFARRAERDGWAADARSTLRALGRIDRARFLAGLAVPPRASRRARGRTLPDQLRRGVGLMRGGTGGAPGGGAAG